MLEGIEDLRAQREKVTEIIDANDLTSAEEKILVDLINLLSTIGEGLDAIEADLDEVDALIKELTAKVSGLDSEAAMKENEDKLNGLEALLK